MSEQLSEIIFSWRHIAVHRHEKNQMWYIVSAVVVALAVIWAVLPGRWFGDKNYLFAVFLVLFYLVVLMLEYRPLEEIETVITPDGIKYGVKFYRFDEFDQFYIVYQDEGVKSLYLEFKNPLRGRLPIPVDSQNPVLLREYLLRHLKEDLEREAEPVSERLRRWLKL